MLFVAYAVNAVYVLPLAPVDSVDTNENAVFAVSSMIVPELLPAALYE